MKLLDSNDNSYIFDLSQQESESIDEVFHEWCETVMQGKWKQQGHQVEILDPELALKFKLRWAIEEV